ncbi:MAG: hypothetical protein JHC21_06285 [Thermocrinis sp.]|nr:hypothetical protein [Thermocrinis sp.]
MPKLDNDSVVQYLNYLYEKSLALSDSLEILERMWEMSKNVDDAQLENFRVEKQAYQSAVSEFASAKDVYIDFIQDPVSYSTLQPATDLQTALRNLVIRQLELKESIETVVPALKVLYPDLFYTSQAVNSTRIFNRLVSGFLSSVSEIANLGFNVLFNPLLEFGYVDLLEGQLSYLRYLLYLQWRSVQYSDLSFDVITPGSFDPSLLPDISQLPQIGSPCYSSVSVRSACYEIWAVCDSGRVVGYNYSPLMDWSPYSYGNPLPIPEAILITDVPRDPVYPWAWEYGPDGLAWTLYSYYFYYLDAMIPIPIRKDSPVSYFNPYPLDEYLTAVPKSYAYSSPGYWHYVYDPCIVCTCQIKPVIAVDNCFNARAVSGFSGSCSCRRVCKFDADDPATYPQEITLPAPSPSPRPSPSFSPFPLPLGDPVPQVEVSPEVLPQSLLDPDTLIQPLPIPSPQRFTVRPSISPDVEFPPGVEFEFPPDPEIDITVDFPPEEFIPAINWIIAQEITSVSTLTDAMEQFLPNPDENSNRNSEDTLDNCREQEQMLYANFDDLRNLILYSFVGLASIFGFISALLVSMSIFELWKNIPIRRV